MVTAITVQHTYVYSGSHDESKTAGATVNKKQRREGSYM